MTLAGGVHVGLLCGGLASGFSGTPPRCAVILLVGAHKRERLGGSGPAGSGALSTKQRAVPPVHSLVSSFVSSESWEQRETWMSCDCASRVPTRHRITASDHHPPTPPHSALFSSQACSTCTCSDGTYTGVQLSSLLPRLREGSAMTADDPPRLMWPLF